MNIPRDPELREIEILRALSDGVETYRELLQRSSYEDISNVRRLCAHLVKARFAKTWMSTQTRKANTVNHWKNRVKIWRLQITPQGQQRLFELERSYASRFANKTG